MTVAEVLVLATAMLALFGFGYWMGLDQGWDGARDLLDRHRDAARRAGDRAGSKALREATDEADERPGWKW